MDDRQALQVEVLTRQEHETGASLFGSHVVIVGEQLSDKQLQRAWQKARRRWINLIQQDSPNTARAYDIAVEQFLGWSPVPAWMVTTAVVADWRLYMRSDEYVRKWDAMGRPVQFGALSKSSVNAKLAALKSFYDFVAYDNRYPIPPGVSFDGQPYVYDIGDGQFALWPIERGNPFDSKIKSVKRFKVSPYGRAQYPTTDELQRILATIDTDYLRGKLDFALIFTAATTCRRFSEFVNLRWGDLHEAEDGNYWFPYRYKGGDERKAVLPKSAFLAICDYLRAAGRLDEMGEDDYIFVATDPERIKRARPDLDVDPNQPLANSTCNAILKKRARYAGVPEAKAHIHGLRHAGLRLRVQQMKEKGDDVDYVEVMHLAGHSTLAVTQIYIDEVCEEPRDEGGEAAAQKLMPKGKRRPRPTPPSPQQPRML
jgi:integrase